MMAIAAIEVGRIWSGADPDSAIQSANVEQPDQNEILKTGKSVAMNTMN